MPTNKERHVPKEERLAPVEEGVLDWEGARVFLEIGRTGSFRAAAVSLHQSVNALRRRFERLEKSVGAMLLTRHVDGVRLTAEGERVLAAARQMEAITFELMRGDDRIGTSTLQVKLAVTEGMGTFWIAPHIADFHKKNAKHVVHMHCSMSPVDVLRLEADVAIQLVRPEAKDLKIVKLGRMHSMAFASRGYIAAHGVPQSADDLDRHALIYQVSDQIQPPEHLMALARAAEARGSAVMRTNTSTSHAVALVNGAGAGLLPTYATALLPSLVPVDIPEIRTQQDIWLVYHPDAGRQKRVQRMIEWLTELFSPRRFPWFGDRFIHPKEFRPIADWKPPFTMS